MRRSDASVVVHKFGGAALADADAIRHAARIIAARPAGAVVVASAMRGVTDTLLDITGLASLGESQNVANALDELRRRHIAAAAELETDESGDSITAAISREFDHLAGLVEQIVAGNPPDAAVTDAIAGEGERISATMFAAALSGLGVNAKVVDATQVVHADALHGNATPDFARTVTAVNEHLLPLIRAHIVPVVAGFIGSAPNGAIVTLGRGGSDLTATLLARAVNA